MLLSLRVDLVNIAYLQADTSKEESQIDALVYQLYGLTEEEVRVVEEG